MPKSFNEYQYPCGCGQEHCTNYLQLHKNDPWGWVISTHRVAQQSTSVVLCPNTVRALVSRLRSLFPAVFKQGRPKVKRKSARKVERRSKPRA